MGNTICSPCNQVYDVDEEIWLQKEKRGGPDDPLGIDCPFKVS